MQTGNNLQYVGLIVKQIVVSAEKDVYRCFWHLLFDCV